ncbi:MgtC/SapB family protein [Oceanobacillus halotolerans]|uniref:MgtC/SapB family protein n=1 Tax=Oceanobacillus halotolerans TaxID=2663380 RepID=UPI0013D8EAF8|nr:MgtC/SapB family protein [Oceanobacillus halotolerans]
MEQFLNNYFIDDYFVIAMVRILIALVLSGLIGFERELKNHSAGFRTHILVGVGACLMMLLSLYGFEMFIDKYDQVRFDPARIPSYVISGIGFLGAGTIIVNGMTIRGLTTAASIWTVAGLGLVVGVGMYATAVFTTLIILLSLVFLNNFERVVRKNRSSLFITVVALSNLKVKELIAVVEDHSLAIKQVEVENVENDLRHIHLKIDYNTSVNKVVLFERLSNVNLVKHVAERN